jgi:8-amino-7-oxononanoate synthase
MVMGFVDRITAESRKIILNPYVLRLATDDRVKRAAEGVLDARTRVRNAFKVLVTGEVLPHVDPALDDTIGQSEESFSQERSPATSGIPNRVNGTATKTVDTSSASSDAEDPHEQLKDRHSLATLGGRDVLEKCMQFKGADAARKMGIYPYFRPLDFNDGPEAVINGQRVTMFGSNNYLGLTTHPKVRAAACAAIERFGTSMTGSRLVNGSMRLHEEFEEKLAAWFDREAALVFTTGYQVNLATCSALLSNKKCVAVVDRNIHASLYDGVRIGQAAGSRLVRYKHNDPKSLERALSKIEPDEGALVLTDGVFSAEGELARLDEVVPICKKYAARLFVDEAHGLGVVGPEGRGSPYHFGLADQVDLIGGTFSKSLASIGGWLVGERKVLDYIRHFAPSFMFAASAAPPSVAAAMAAFDVMREETWRIDKLRGNFTYMREELRKMGFELGHTQTAVIPIFIRQDLRTLMMWRDLLEEHGIYTNPFISPGVPPKSAMLRTSYMATHERAHLDRGLEAFYKVGKKYGVI